MADGHRARAATLMLAGELDRARVEAANLLRIDPRNVEDLVLAARIARGLGNIQRAASYLLSAHEIDPDHVEARVALAQLHVLGQQYDDAEALLQPIFHARPDHAIALSLRAAIRLASDDKAAAYADLERALTLDPTNSVALPIMSAILRVDEGPQAAIAMLEKALDAEPDRRDLLHLLVRIYVESGEFAAAADALGRLQAGASDSSDLRAHRAALLQKAGAAERGEQLLREGIARDATNTNLKLALIRHLVRDGRKDQALQTLDAFVNTDGRAFDLRVAQAAMFGALGFEQQARDAYVSILSSQPELKWRTEATVGLAQFEHERNRPDAALATVDALLETEANNALALAMRARLRLDAGDVDGAVSDLYAALSSDRDNADYRYDLAKLHVQRREFVLAEVQLRQLLEQEPGVIKAHELLVKLHIEQGNLAEAKRESDRLLALSPTPTAASLAFDVARRSGHWARAAEHASRLKSAYPKRALGPFLCGVAALGVGDRAAAEREFKDALAIDPLAQEPLSALTRLLLEQQRTAEVVERLDATLAIDAAHPIALQWRAQVFLRSGDASKAAALFERATAERAELIDAWRGLAASRLRLGDRAGAEAALRQGIEAVERAKQEQLSVDLTLLLLGNGDPVAAVTEAERYLRAVPDSKITMNNLAMILIEHEPYENSLARARVLVEVLVPSSDESFVDTYAMVMTKAGATEAAIEAIDHYLKRERPSALLRYRRGNALAMRGDNEAAARDWRAAVQAAPTASFVQDARNRLRSLL